MDVNVEGTIAHKREAIELYVETPAEMGEEFPSAKGLKYHIQNELLKADEIAEGCMPACYKTNMGKGKAAMKR